MERKLTRARKLPAEAKTAKKPEPPHIDVSVSSNDLSATVRLKGDRELINFTEEDIMRALQQNGVIFGIDREAVQKALRQPGRSFIVALAQDPVNGEDGQIVFQEKFAGEKGKPKELEDGRVDYKNIDMFPTVLENELIAEKIPATPGADGVSVKGRPLKSVAGKDKRIKTGRYALAEDNRVVAKTAGHLIITGDKIDVIPVLSVNGDIDLSTGNVVFPGNVSVRGSVNAGFSVRAEGKVTVNGSIFGSVEARMVEVRHGIQGAEDSMVCAEETVSAKFIENAAVSAGTDVLAVDTILQSKVRAGKQVLVTGRRGVIVGGHVMAGELIEASNIGTYMVPPTTIEVGVNPIMKEDYVRLSGEYKKTSVDLEDVNKSLWIIKPGSQAEVPPERQKLFLKLTSAKFALQGKLAEIKERLEYIDGEFQKLKGGQIRCSGYVFPGVKLVVSNVTYTVQDTLRGAMFFLSDGEVKFASFEHRGRR
jgi:uncharacterized protein (DUF342 family)